MLKWLFSRESVPPMNLRGSFGKPRHRVAVAAPGYYPARGSSISSAGVTPRAAANFRIVLG